MPCLYLEQRAIPAAWEHPQVSPCSGAGQIPRTSSQTFPPPSLFHLQFSQGTCEREMEGTPDRAQLRRGHRVFPAPAACCPLKIKIVCTNSVTQGCHWMMLSWRWRCYFGARYRRWYFGALPGLQTAGSECGSSLRVPSVTWFVFSCHYFSFHPSLSGCKTEAET